LEGHDQSVVGAGLHAQPEKTSIPVGQELYQAQSDLGRFGDMTKTQPLPYSDDFEKGLLSSIRYQPEILLEIPYILHTDVLYVRTHRLILEAFGAITEHSNTQPAEIDFLAVKNYFLASGKLEEAGGEQLFDEIWEFVPSAANWRYYAEGVVESYHRRIAILESRRLIERMYDLQRPVEETIRETIERTFARLAITTGPGGDDAQGPGTRISGYS
jgi:replicative DNA helicase